MSDLATPPVPTSAAPSLLLIYIGLPAIALLLNKPEIAKAIVATEAGSLAGGYIGSQFANNTDSLDTAQSLR
jgi:hypothetical protein